VYEFLTFDEQRHIPFATLPDMHDRSLTISSTGKTFGMTGWKIGYTLASETLTEAVRTVHQFATFAVNTPGQYAMAHALDRLEDYIPVFRTLYSDKRDLLENGLQDSALTAHRPEGTYFMMVSLPADAGMDDVQWSLRLVKEHGVAVIPPSVFYSRGTEGKSMLRLCFAKTDETLHAGISRLQQGF